MNARFKKALAIARQAKKAKARSLRSGDTRSAKTKDEWLTPPDIIQALGPFDLDPCAPVNRPWATAANHFTIRDNGLKQGWAGSVWLNPPYGNAAGAWLDRLVQHGDGIALVAIRTETKWFQRAMAVAAAVFFFEGRIYFHHVDGRRGGPARSGHVLLAFGEKAAQRLRFLNLRGIYFPAVQTHFIDAPLVSRIGARKVAA